LGCGRCTNQLRDSFAQVTEKRVGGEEPKRMVVEDASAERMENKEIE
jgi:hypothetical protein